MAIKGEKITKKVVVNRTKQGVDLLLSPPLEDLEVLRQIKRDYMMDENSFYDGTYLIVDAEDPNKIYN